MNYEIIFYHAGKTAATELLLQTYLKPLGAERSGSAAATEPDELPALLKAALYRSELIWIIGGLDDSRQSTDGLLSSVLSSAGASIRSEKLLDDSGNTAYLLRAGRQTIILLPDKEEVICHMLEKRLLSELKSTYSLRSADDGRPPIEQVARELDRQLASMPRKPVVMSAAPAPRSSRRALCLWSGIFAAVSLLLLSLCILFALL